MKPLAALPLITILTLTGCTPAPQTNEAPQKYSSSGIKPLVTQDLTPEDKARIETSKTTIKVGDAEYPYAVIVTEADHPTKNGDATQSKHIRITLDTGLLNDCTVKTGTPAGTKKIFPGESGRPDCLSGLLVRTAPSQDTKSGNGDETAVITTLPHGRNIIEFNSIYSDYVGMEMKMGSGKSTFVNALTGEVLAQETFGYKARQLTPEFKSGLTAEQTNELANTKPQYTKENYSMTLGKPIITKNAEGRSTLQFPIITKLTPESCSEETETCYEFSLETENSRNGVNRKGTNNTEDHFTIPEGFTGLLTVDSPDFDEAHFFIYTRGVNGGGTTHINLLTGEIASSQ